jgi:hypothetical protein
MENKQTTAIIIITLLVIIAGALVYIATKKPNAEIVLPKEEIAVIEEEGTTSRPQEIQSPASNQNLFSNTSLALKFEAPSNSTSPVFSNAPAGGSSFRYIFSQYPNPIFYSASISPNFVGERGRDPGELKTTAEYDTLKAQYGEQTNTNGKKYVYINASISELGESGRYPSEQIRYAYFKTGSSTYPILGFFAEGISQTEFMKVINSVQ